jgi:predicted nucleic acid-binding protein
MIGVVDTSAFIRLFIPDGPLPDGFDEFMRGVERGLHVAIAPELLMAEAANVVSKKRKSGEISVDESDQLLSELLSVPIRLFSHRPIIPRAFAMAGEHNVTVYDALYLALAEEHGAVIYSADSSLRKVASNLRLLDE